MIHGEVGIGHGRCAVIFRDSTLKAISAGRCSWKLVAGSWEFSSTAAPGPDPA
jgi:hypothetical protein